jgi:uncharacterized protein YggE
MNNSFKVILKKNDITAYQAVADVLVSIFKITNNSKIIYNILSECQNNGTVILFENTEIECNRIKKQAQEYCASKSDNRSFYQNLEFEVIR